MTREYTGFPIANFRTGFYEALEPWLYPNDAFQVLKNAHQYRGVVEKIQGYNFFARTSYRQIVTLSGLIDGVNRTYSGVLVPVPSTNNTVVQSLIAPGVNETFVDDGNGVLTSDNGGTGTINYVANVPVAGQPAGYITVTFGTAPIQVLSGGVEHNAVLFFYDYTPAALPIMGIEQYIDQTGNQDVLVFDTRRVGKIIPLLGSMATLQQSRYGITGLPYETQTLAVVTGFNNTPGPFTGTVTAPLVPGTLQFQVFDSSSPTANLLETITDNGFNGLSGDAGATGFISYATGQWRLTFIGNQPNTNTMKYSACVFGNTFTGDFTNFFSVVNYQNKMFLTNNVDPPMYFDGTCVKYLNTNLSVKLNTIAPYEIGKCLHVTVNRERLLLVSVFINAVPNLNAIYWSETSNPLNFTNDEQLFAPTSEPIRTFSFINSDMVVRFSNSERVFRYTSDFFSPFRWDSTNSVWRCDASYSAINYDSWFSSVGRPAIVGSDGVNVKRVDEIIPDFTLNLRVSEQQPVPSIDQRSIGQCYGKRFDDFKEGWLCYRSFNIITDGEIQPSNSVLAFNYLDSTYAVYTFPFSCLGFGRIISQEVWGNNFDLWGEADYAWYSYSQTENALINLAGDQNGTVYELASGNSITDIDGNVIPCLMDIITKDFNPFVEQGELCRLGYVDFLLSSNDETKFRVQFYKDNQLNTNFDTYYQETTLTLTGNAQSKIWKRIYVGAVGKSHTLRIYQNEADFAEDENQPIRIHAIVPYFKPAGRIFY